MLNTTNEAMLHLEFLKFVSGIGYWTFQQQDQYISYTLIVLLVVCVIMIFFLNSFVISFYRSKFTDTIPFLFILVAVGDMATGIAGLLNTLSLLTYQQVHFSENDPSFVDPHFESLVTVNYLWCNVAVKMSVFVNVILAVIRAGAIFNPFQIFKIRLITLCSGLYLMLWVLIVAGEVHFTKQSIEKNWKKYLDEYSEHPNFSNNSKMFMHAWYFLFTTVPGYMLSLEGIGQIEKELYCSDLYTCSYHFCYHPPEDASFDNEQCEQFFGFFWLIIPNVLPALIVLACLVTIIRTLQKPIDGAADVETSAAAARQTTVSVLLVSILYIVSNTISFIFIVIIIYTPILNGGSDGVINSGDHITVIDSDKVRAFYWFMFAFQNVFPLLSSLLNPVIIISRGTALRNSFKMTLRSNGSG